MLLYIQNKKRTSSRVDRKHQLGRHGIISDIARDREHVTSLWVQEEASGDIGGVTGSQLHLGAPRGYEEAGDLVLGYQGCGLDAAV